MTAQVIAIRVGDRKATTNAATRKLCRTSAQKYLIAQTQGNGNPTGVFAGIVILAAFVLLIDVVLDFAGKRLITWRPMVQRTQAA